MSLWAFVCSVLLCFSVRNRTLPLYDTTQKQHAGEFFLSRRVFFSLTERTEFTEHFCAQFRAHRRPPAYRVHRALLLKVAVKFCDIGWLNVSVGLCVFCSSVFFCEKKNAPTWWDDIHANLWGGLSLTELTDLTEPYSALFRSHRTPPAYRFHRTLHLSLDVTCVRERVNKIIINLYN